MKKNSSGQDPPAEPLDRVRLQAEVARQRVRIAKDELKRARKRLKEAKREAKRARKLAAAARKAWKRARRAQKGQAQKTFASESAEARAAAAPRPGRARRLPRARGARGARGRSVRCVACGAADARLPQAGSWRRDASGCARGECGVPLQAQLRDAQSHDARFQALVGAHRRRVPSAPRRLQRFGGSRRRGESRRARHPHAHPEFLQRRRPWQRRVASPPCPRRRPRAPPGSTTQQSDRRRLIGRPEYEPARRLRRRAAHIAADAATTRGDLIHAR